MIEIDWMNNANCKGQTYLFFAPPAERPQARERRERKAVELCKVCPVAAECAAYAAAQNEQYGIWGGIPIGL
jgi:WhiB family redox-sensing transcriptional regulator